jgi:CBS domain-containing protein
VLPDRLGGEVLYEMLERGIRHAPVVTERGHLVGVLEDTDLFGAQPRSWFGARRMIDRARRLESLKEVAERLPALMLDLHRAEVPALELTRVLSALVDALTARAIELALPVRELPGEGIVWVTLGSQARRELTLGSTRRGALVYDPELELEPGWYEGLEPALELVGMAEPIVARDGQSWIRAAATEELALSVVADRRPLWGTPVEPLPRADGPARDRLLEALADRAFGHSAPTGFDEDAVLALDGARHDRLNIRSAAIVPIAALARWAAAVAGAGEGSTPERLKTAAEAGVLDQVQAQTLAEAFELALGLRMTHQLEQLAGGERTDDLLDPAAMSPLTRSHLRDVFLAVNAVAREIRP